MAVILTIVLLGLIMTGQGLPGWNTLGLFALQMGMGLVAGIGGGQLLVWLTHRLRMERGMYPMLILAGVVIGNRALREARNILQVHGGLSWLAQIGMFLMLGLLATPRSVLDDAPVALAIALVLMFVARPLTVWLCLLPFRFPPREQLFIAWVGLRGAGMVEELLLGSVTKHILAESAGDVLVSTLD